MPFSQLCFFEERGRLVQVHRFFCHFQSLKFDIFSLMKEDDRIIRRRASENEPFMRLTDVSSKKFLMMLMISDVDDSDDFSADDDGMMMAMI